MNHASIKKVFQAMPKKQTSDLSYKFTYELCHAIFINKTIHHIDRSTNIHQKYIKVGAKKIKYRSIFRLFVKLPNLNLNANKFIRNEHIFLSLKRCFVFLSCSHGPSGCGTAFNFSMVNRPLASGKWQNDRCGMRI